MVILVNSLDNCCCFFLKLIWFPKKIVKKRRQNCSDINFFLKRLGIAFVAKSKDKCISFFEGVNELNSKIQDSIRAVITQKKHKNLDFVFKQACKLEASHVRNSAQPLT